MAVLFRLNTQGLRQSETHQHPWHLGLPEYPDSGASAQVETCCNSRFGGSSLLQSHCTYRENN